MNRENASYRNPVHRAEHGNLSVNRAIILTAAGDEAGNLLGTVARQPQKTLYLSMKVFNKPVAGLLVDIGYRSLETGDHPQAFATDLDLTAASPVGGTELLTLPYAMDETNVDDANASTIHDIIVTLKGTVDVNQSFQLIYSAIYPGT